MSHSKVEVCNIALARIGASQTIADIDEESESAAACALFFDICLEATLRDWAWPFANRTADLAQVAAAPNSDWGYSYRLPVDCVRAIRIRTGDRNDTVPPPFEATTDSSGGLLFCDLEAVELQYTGLVTTPSLWQADFISALAWRLAWEIAAPLARSDSQRDRAARAYVQAVTRAEATASNERQADPEMDAEAIRER
jgi:hypothetical protein